VGSGQAGYEGMTFDGRYIYFSPRSGYVNRFDTQGSFTSSSSWSSFNVSTLNALATNYRDAAFDGQYVYFSDPAVAGVIARYDTNQSLTSSNAWSFARLNPTDQQSPNLGGFAGTLFDGQNMYFVPFSGGVSGGPLWRSWAGYVVAQYDTLGSNAGFSLMSSSGFQSMRGSSNLGPRFQIKTSNGYFSATSKTLLDSSWHYLVGTYDGSTINLYIDGSLAATAPATGTLNSNSNSASIGNFASTTGSANGLINDAQVYSSALSSSQIQALYSSTLCQ